MYARVQLAAGRERERETAVVLHTNRRGLALCRRRTLLSLKYASTRFFCARVAREKVVPRDRSSWTGSAGATAHQDIVQLPLAQVRLVLSAVRLLVAAQPQVAHLVLGQHAAATPSRELSEPRQ